jgi:hypothetical protein
MAQLAAPGWRFHVSSDLLAMSREEASSVGSASAENAPKAPYLGGFNFGAGTGLHRVNREVSPIMSGSLPNGVVLACF